VTSTTGGVLGINPLDRPEGADHGSCAEDEKGEREQFDCEEAVAGA
jgi:hypothetical protein